MTNRISLKSLYLGRTTLFILTLLFSTTFLNAQTVTFAQFFEVSGTNDFIFSNNAISSNFNTISGGSNITFVYQNIGGLPAELQGTQSAHIFITAGTTAPAFINAGRTVQPFNQTFTIQILRNSPTSPSVGLGARTNLLTAVITPIGGSTSDLSGDTSGSSAAYTATTPNQVVTYTSDFLDFSALEAERNLAISFSSVEPSYAMGPGGFLRSFGAAASGTFASNPGPIYNTPTAAPAIISGRVLNTKGKGVAGARVSMTDSAGTIALTRTNSFGYYQLEVETGQTVIINVTSKQNVYAPRILNVSQELDGFDFIPQ